ncbi:MAG: SDR family NAD(P)-dependent oxidoreductase [Akkermansiaceae bacterium]|nr:SDR family NAD(P)-dependent oxidoreductase [Akkermansiaceae bacterium]
MIDLDGVLGGVADTHEIKLLLRLICQVGHQEDQFALRQGCAYVPRLVKQTLEQPLVPLDLRGDRTYLITGGLGSLGLYLSDWLVRQGAQHLVLMGRRTPSAEDKVAIAQMEAQGVQVLVCETDVTQLEQVADVLRKIDTSMPPLRGIIHAAGISGFQSIEQIHWKDFEAVLSPKVTGTWILHHLTQNYPLDFFVTCSSIASVWGSKGQSHYAAANQFLDGLAHYRHGQGQPTLSVNWGPWDQGGMIQEQEKHMLGHLGVKLLQPAEGGYALNCLLSPQRMAQSCQATIANIDWSIFKPLYEVGKRRQLLALLEASSLAVQSPTYADLGTESALITSLQAVPVEERDDHLQEYLQKTVAEVLGLSTAGFSTTQALGREQGFFEMGMDSLMAMDLKERLEQDLQTKLPTTLAFEAPNLTSLAQYIAQEVLNWLPPKPEELQEPASFQEKVFSSDALELQQRIEQMTEGNLEDLINRELQALTGEVL